MANVVSKLIVSLVDQISGPAKNAAGALNAIDKSAANLAKQKKFALPAGIAAEMERLKSSQKTVDAVTASWIRLKQTLAEKPVKADHFFRINNEWHQKTLANIRAIRREEAALRAGSGIGAGAAGLAGGLAGAYGVRRVVKGAVKAGATNARENTRDYLGGLTPSESAALVAGAKTMSATYKTLDAATAHERLRDTAMSMGSVDKAIGLQDTLGAGHTVLQSLKGPEAALEESRKFFKALDTLGRNVDAGEVRTLYDGYIKALGVEGADMNMGDLFTVAKMAKSGGAALSNRFLMSIAPSLMQDMGPNRLGTALGSMVSQVIGGRATAKSKGEQEKYGLRDKSGKFLDEAMIMADPMEYAQKRLIPALKAQGVNVEDNTAVTAANSKLFSNQMVADLFTKIITQLPQYQRKAEQYDKAPGIGAANKLGGSDPFVAADGLMAQLRNLGAALSEPIMQPATTAMEKLSGLVNGLAESAKSGGSALMQFTAGIGALVAGAGIGATALKGMLPGIFGTAPAAVAGPAAVLGGVAAGGAAASVIAAEIVKNNKEAFIDTAENPMLGALSGDTGLAAAIQNARALAAAMKAREDAIKAEARARIDAKKTTFGVPGGTTQPGGVGQDGLGDLGDQVQGMLNKLDKSSDAGSAGQRTGAAYTDNLRSELSAAEQMVAESAARMQGMLNFKASPQITPSVGAPSGGGAPGKQSSRATATRLGALVDDRMRGSFHDTEFG